MLAAGAAEAIKNKWEIVIAILDGRNARGSSGRTRFLIEFSIPIFTFRANQ